MQEGQYVATVSPEDIEWERVGLLEAMCDGITTRYLDALGWLFRIVISASMHAGLRMIPRESAFFSRACKPISLEDCPLSRHCEGVCPPDIMVCALVRGSPRDIRGDSRCKSH
jgi:hypothetical protein